MTNIAFLGLGVMGYPMAGHLQRAGHKVTVYNRTTSKAEKWAKEYEGSFGVTPAEAAKDADIVFSCVGNDNDLRSVTTGKDGAFNGMKSGAIFADHTTASADVARELYAAAKERKLHFLDAPVSGGQGGAEKGILTIMVGGDADIFAKVEHALKAYGKIVQLMGPSGSGQLTKMVNQICIVGIIQGLSEGLNFARAAGLDIPTVLSTIRGGAAGSWQLENRGSTMGEGKFNFGFAVDLMRKDLGICMAEAKRNHAPLPLTALIDQFYADIQNMGGSSFDTSSLILRLTSKKPA
jgi:3-hydroxyisobutyrate dehydrogenase